MTGYQPKYGPDRPSKTPIGGSEVKPGKSWIDEMVEYHMNNIRWCRANEGACSKQIRIILDNFTDEEIAEMLKNLIKKNSEFTFDTLTRMEKNL